MKRPVSGCWIKVQAEPDLIRLSLWEVAGWAMTTMRIGALAR